MHSSACLLSARHTNCGAGGFESKPKEDRRRSNKVGGDKRRDNKENGEREEEFRGRGAAISRGSSLPLSLPLLGRPLDAGADLDSDKLGRGELTEEEEDD